MAATVMAAEENFMSMIDLRCWLIALYLMVADVECSRLYDEDGSKYEYQGVNVMLFWTWLSRIKFLMIFEAMEIFMGILWGRR